MMSDKRGVTLIELLIAVAILGLVMVSIGQLLDSGVQDWQRGETKLEAEQNIRIAMEKISKDLRGAQQVLASEATEQKLVIRLPQNVKVEYYLGSLSTGPGGITGKTLKRTFAKYSDANLTTFIPGQGYPLESEIAGYLESINFAYDISKADASLVKITIRSGTLPAGDNLEISSGIALRAKFLPRR